MAHCILNVNAKVQGLGNYSSSIIEVINVLYENEIGIIQLPCPEMTIYGVKRWGHVKEQFDTPHFREQCQQIIRPVVDQLKDYTKNNYRIVGVIGVDGSPSCGVGKTCSGNWGGEIAGRQDLTDVVNNVKCIKQPGVFMEELQELFSKNNIDVPFTAVDEINAVQSINRIRVLIKENIKHQ